MVNSDSNPGEEPLPLEPPAEELDYEETDLKDDLVSFDIEDSDIAAVEQPSTDGTAGPATTAISGDDDEVTVVAVKKGDTKKEEEG